MRGANVTTDHPEEDHEAAELPLGQSNICSTTTASMPKEPPVDHSHPIVTPDLYPCRDEVFHGRAVWAWGEDGDMGVMVEGHGRRALAAMNAYQRCLLGANWRFRERMEPEATEIWVIVHEECGCTAEQHAEHAADVADCCDNHCKRYGLPPCTTDLFGWTIETVSAGTPRAVAMTEVSW